MYISLVNFLCSFGIINMAVKSFVSFEMYVSGEHLQ